jgi:hypothetical protein
MRLTAIARGNRRGDPWDSPREMPAEETLLRVTNNSGEGVEGVFMTDLWYIVKKYCQKMILGQSLKPEFEKL